MDWYKIPLKLKYRSPGTLIKRAGIDPPEGTWVYTCGGGSKSSNSGGNKKRTGQGLGERRRQGWGSVAR